VLLLVGAFLSLPMFTRKADAFGAHDLVLQSQQLLAQVSAIGSFLIQTAESFSSDILKLFSSTGNENTKVLEVEEIILFLLKRH
jgi:hypothetical protein